MSNAVSLSTKISVSKITLKKVKEYQYQCKIDLDKIKIDK